MIVNLVVAFALEEKVSSSRRSSLSNVCIEIILSSLQTRDRDP